MVALRNTSTGVVVNVSDDKAGRFDSSWVPADKPAPKTADKPTSTPKKSVPKK